jgi:hypothetical protein
MDLGPDPREHIEYLGENSFYIGEAVEERLRAMNVVYTTHELESIFLPFLDPEIRRIIQRFDRGLGGPVNRKRYGSEEMLTQQRNLHPFDKRRLHYLRCGRVDIGNLDMRPWKFLNVLLEKSRDEIEALFEDMERELPPYEIRSYLFTALHIQTHFRHLITRNQPSALDPERVDHYFMVDLCRLNRNEPFFRGVERHDPQQLHPYLVRYLILYFDNGFELRSMWQGLGEDFLGPHRAFRHPPRKTADPLSGEEEEACKWLGVSPGQFKAMGRSELLSQFRQRAMATHPDRGGNPEEFVRIQRAYECLRRRKH